MTKLDELFGLAGWMADAACREHPDVNFHPTRGEDTTPARSVCSACLVREECLGYALALPDDNASGVWGGLSARERRLLRHRQRAA